MSCRVEHIYRANGYKNLTLYTRIVLKPLLRTERAKNMCGASEEIDEGGIHACFHGFKSLLVLGSFAFDWWWWLLCH